MKVKLSPFQIIAASLSFLIFILACSLVTGTPSETSPPPVDNDSSPPTQIPQPTQAIEPTNPPPVDQQPPSCYKWDQITLDMAGEKVCVYGVAYSEQGQHRLDFSPKKNSFFLIDPVYFYPNLSAGDCVIAEAKVEVFDGSIPFMTIKDGLYKCEPWMME